MFIYNIKVSELIYIKLIQLIHDLCYQVTFMTAPVPLIFLLVIHVKLIKLIHILHIHSLLVQTTFVPELKINFTPIV